MSKKDITSKELFSSPHIAASFSNVILANGAFIFKGKYMKLVDTEQPNAEEEANGALRVDSRRRDMLYDTLVQFCKAMYRMLIGFEFQSTPDAKILCRVMDYDGRNYRTQRRTRNGKFVPVFTIVVYTGEKPWNPEKELTEMLDRVPAFMNGFRSNYRMIFVDL